MTKRRWFASLLGLSVALGVSSGSAQAQNQFALVIGKPFKAAAPADFYLEGVAIPLAQRHATMLRTPRGARMLVSLLDVSGFTSEISQKYVGMIITEGDLFVCGQKLTVGGYGFGWQRPGRNAEGPGALSFYNQAGEKLGECATPRDATLDQPKPLQVLVRGDTATLYYGRYGAEMK